MSTRASPPWAVGAAGRHRLAPQTIARFKARVRRRTGGKRLSHIGALSHEMPRPLGTVDQGRYRPEAVEARPSTICTDHGSTTGGRVIGNMFPHKQSERIILRTVFRTDGQHFPSSAQRKGASAQSAQHHRTYGRRGIGFEHRGFAGESPYVRCTQDWQLAALITTSTRSFSSVRGTLWWDGSYYRNLGRIRCPNRMW
jgi:hypothetical protein